MIPVIPLIYLFFLHFLGDFVFQSDWMAQNKSKQFFPLLAHADTYAGVMWIGLMVLPMFYGYPFGTGALWAAMFAAVNSAAHLGIDFVTSKINARLWAAGKTHWFFVSVGFDQFLHMAVLLLSLRIII